MPGGLSLLAGGLNAGRWRRHPRLGLRTEMRRVWTLRGRRPMVDHGNHTRRFGKIYHVGNYEGATRNCLIIATPAQKTAGQKTDALAQAVDLAPTLIELCSLPANPGFQGRSLKPEHEKVLASKSK